MHIGYIVSQYPGISHTFVQREILALRKLGWTVSTFSIRPPNPRELLTDTDRREAQNTRVILTRRPAQLLPAIFLPLLAHPLRSLATLRLAWRNRRPGLRGALWSFFYFLEALVLHRHCRRAGISHIHAHFANVACDVALLASHFARATFSFTMHGPTEFFDLKEHRLAEKARAASFIICISDFARSQLMPLLPFDHWDKLEVVHCGIDPAQFTAPRLADPSPLASLESVHPPPGRNGECDARLLCVARLVPVKAHAVLLKACADLVIRGFRIHLTFIGDGPSRGDLERLARVLGIASCVTFAGNIGQHQILDHFHRADLFVLPSFAEGVPVVLMEAMATGLPVIATRIAGISELIEDGHSGILVPPGRADLLARAIQRLLLDPAAARQFAQAALKKVRREFNINTLSIDLARIFEERLASAAPAPSTIPPASRASRRPGAASSAWQRPDAAAPVPGPSSSPLRSAPSGDAA